jgi:hypothetical protein
MNALKSCLALIFAFSLFLAAADGTYVPVKLAKPLEAVLPADLKYLLIENPQVIYQVKVGPAGDLMDAVAVEATHYGLLPRGEEKILDAEFEPALLEGEPVVGKISVIITFFDPEQRAWERMGMPPQGGSVSDAVARRLYEANKENFRYKESRPQDLDDPLQLIESKLCLVHPPDEEMVKGRVLVEYFIDFEGHVHLPNVIESDHDYLTLSALKTLEHTRFAPPRRNGNPALVSVRQPFNFD